MKPRQQGRAHPARGKPGGPMRPRKGKGSYNRKSTDEQAEMPRNR